MLRHGSLFSGIGGFDIASSWMGWQNVFSCEKDPFCRTILKHYWPNTTHYEDIYDFNATQFRGHMDIISGGFPCQPFSQAGRRRGTKDDRYLFPETIRIIKQARPDWIVLENVAGLFTILDQDSLSEMEVQAIELFCTDNDQKASPTIIRLQRRVIGQIISEFGSAGYVLPALEDGTPVILCIPAAAVNAPHRRDRVWFSGLLPTPNTIQIERITINPQTIQTVEQTMKDGTPRQRSIKDALIVMAAENGLIPAVTTKGSNTATARMISTQVHDGSIHNVTPKRLIALLPPLMESGVMKLKNHQQINTDTIKFLIGMTGQLNPMFLAEMMGFPKYWTELPFLRGVPTV